MPDFSSCFCFALWCLGKRCLVYPATEGSERGEQSFLEMAGWGEEGIYKNKPGINNCRWQGHWKQAASLCVVPLEGHRLVLTGLRTMITRGERGWPYYWDAQTLGFLKWDQELVGSVYLGFLCLLSSLLPYCGLHTTVHVTMWFSQ